jgi:hypothetical protein
VIRCSRCSHRSWCDLSHFLLRNRSNLNINCDYLFLSCSVEFDGMSFVEGTDTESRFQLAITAPGNTAALIRKTEGRYDKMFSNKQNIINFDKETGRYFLDESRSIPYLRDGHLQDLQLLLISKNKSISGGGCMHTARNICESQA